jgi:hypothetical protein
MPLNNYGVLLGAKVGYHRDQPDNFGKYYHGHIDVQTPGQLYNTAIDVDSNRPGVSVQWKVLPLRGGEWQSIFTLADGFHQLASNETSGAVDYIRDHRLHEYILVPEYVAGPLPWWKRFPPWIYRIPDAWRVLIGAAQVITPPRPAQTLMARLLADRLHLVDITPPWKTGTDVQALTDLEAMITDAPRVVIFGEFYPAKNNQPPGLHDIHLNQGDPPGSQWWSSNGIWQDGLTIAIHSDGTASAFMNKFSTQSLNTDNQGHPL